MKRFISKLILHDYIQALNLGLSLGRWLSYFLSMVKREKGVSKGDLAYKWANSPLETSVFV